MNILLLGEYSNLFNNLAEGLRRLGHSVMLVSDGDGWKNYYRDININPASNNKFIRTAERYYLEFKAAHSLKGFDIVQVINPLVFSRFGPETMLYEKLKKQNGSIFLSAVGDDYFYWEAFRKEKFRYSPHAGNLVDSKLDKSVWESPKLKRRNEWFLENAKAIIASMADYYIPYKDLGCNLEYIPFPIVIDKLQYEPFEVSEKLTLFHGIQSHRRGFKGTDTILEALEILKGKYPDDIEFQTVADLPFNVYIKSYQKAHILIDQLNIYSPAMNALSAMAIGKVVAGGFSKECQEINNCFPPPMIPVEPDLDIVVERLANAIEHKDSLRELSKRGRDFVMSNHDCKLVAEKYIECWGRY